MSQSPKSILPDDGTAGTLVARVFEPGAPGGPSVALVTDTGLISLAAAFPTMSALLETADPAAAARQAARTGRMLGTLDAARANSGPDGDRQKLHLLAPVDLQAVKAAGVTFAASLLERVIEEKATGDPRAATELRTTITEALGGDLAGIEPGSTRAMQVKALLVERGVWSPYLEVGIGPDAEIFTKGQPLSSVGPGAEVGLHPQSDWNNPEPEVAVLVASDGAIKGATLANDVNLRDFEGRSALLLGKAKDNNASCAIGPFVRLFDATFSLDDVRRAEVSLDIAGEDGFTLQAASSMAKISRDPADLVAQTIGAHHQYPDGLVLLTGTMFAPTKDRDRPGEGFTHKTGDVVTIATDKLGRLTNRVTRSDRATPWTFGVGALMQNLAARGLL